MTGTGHKTLRRGWTTGACATAATKAALMALWGDGFPTTVQIRLPGGQEPVFALAHHAQGEGWAEVGVVKDAGDDPDVTHGALVIARVSEVGFGVSFHAGDGVGTVTRAGLPIAVGEPAINPVPRKMMSEVVAELAQTYGRVGNVAVTISIPGGQDLAAKTWNPRLGILGGLSILGTSGIVRPFSCSAWIASIHRGIDVARAAGLTHVAGTTGATSERVVQSLYGLPDHAMLDMGDFVLGMVKYLRKHPVQRLTLGGGLGKLIKLGQGAGDLHSGRSQIDFARLADRLGDPRLVGVNTALEAYEIIGEDLSKIVADDALVALKVMLGSGIEAEVIVIDRSGQIIGRAQ